MSERVGVDVESGDGLAVEPLVGLNGDSLGVVVKPLVGLDDKSLGVTVDSLVGFGVEKLVSFGVEKLVSQVDGKSLAMAMEEPISDQVISFADSDEVDFVIDSTAGDTIVPDSQVEDVTVLCESFNEIEIDAASTLTQLHATKVSKFQLDRESQYVSNLMHPIMFPGWYGRHDHQTNETAADLLWISHGYAPRLGLSEIHVEALESEEFEEVKFLCGKSAFLLCMQTWMNLDVLAFVMALFSSMENLDVFGF